MRGKPTVRAVASRERRIIPAHAGQTLIRAGRRRHEPDHPRACGANPPTRQIVQLGCGSSPRMRGKRVERLLRGLGRRIIPAHAGQTDFVAEFLRVLPDHPRACGANSASRSVTISTVGSSPRMRGKRSQCAPSRGSARIIPAHAGQTAVRCHVGDTPTDHPRACGANSGTYDRFEPSTGSSPRMRGKHEHRRLSGNTGRIIPAHAGQTP